MILEETAIPGVMLVTPAPMEDGRGFFARTYCRETFEAAGLMPCDDQWSISWNATAGTLRGLHYQAPPHAEAKLVRVTRGAIFDVAVSLSDGRTVTAELDEENRQGLYIPPGVAHGFITLTDETEVLYGISPPHAPGHGRGIHWDDPYLAIPWPLAPRVISERDAGLPLFQDRPADLAG